MKEKAESLRFFRKKSFFFLHDGPSKIESRFKSDRRGASDHSKVTVFINSFNSTNCMSFIARFSLDNSRLTIVFIAAVLLLGLNQFFHFPRQERPS